MHYLRDGIMSLVFCFLLTAPLAAQISYEKEFKLEKHEVPSKARSFIDSCFIKNVKWYSIENQAGESIKAKAKLGGHLYSIGFDTSGCIQDVNKKIKFNSFDPLIRKKIKRALKSNFGSYRIKKTQIQWKATNPTLQLLVKTGNAESKYSIRFDLLIKSRINGPKRYFKVLFDDKGMLESINEFVPKPS